MKQASNNLSLAVGSQTTVLTLNLDTGSYVLLAKVMVQSASNDVTTECSLVNGATTLDFTRFTIYKRTSVNDAGVIVLQAPVTLASAATISVRCTASAADGLAVWRTLTAFKATSIVIQ